VPRPTRTNTNKVDGAKCPLIEKIFNIGVTPMKSKKDIAEDLRYCLRSMEISNCNSMAEEKIKELIAFFEQQDLHIVKAPPSRSDRK